MTTSKLYLFLLLVIQLSCTRETDALFQSISSRHSGIHFNNQIIENDSVNQLDNENVYNGGGAGIGDFDNDGLPDIFLTGNLVSCKLYLNKSGFKFKDVTDEANVSGSGKWCRGVAVVDINNDGWQDLYVSATQKKDPSLRKNLLYINQGLNKNQVPFFIEDAAGYGLDDDSHTTQANFFDYDNDGDLDVYLVVNEINEKISPYLFRHVLKNGDNPSTGKLFRNDFNSSLKHPVFTDVSKEAGIQTEGYSHSAIITDINKDGWKDIYVGNDFLANDLLWINNRNGTFTDELNNYFKHTSANSMGNDVEDINNDGLMDFISLDMNPEDNYRKKMMLPPDSYQTFQNTERYGYNYQYMRNTLQLNLGPGDSTGRPVFSEIGYYAGITATDWSWTPMLTDFDNDGFRDLIVCNGFPKDITDHDFAMFRAKAFYTAPKAMILLQIPEVKLHNYAFRNNSDLTFTDVSAKWGMNTATFSNGASYADFDQDGDLDIIINNINDEASLYKNQSREKYKDKSHFIRVKFNGEPLNKMGLGAWVEIYYDNDKKQVWENSPYRGYLSTIEDAAHFGLNEVTIVDSLIVKWPEGRMQVLKNLTCDQVITLNIEDADVRYSWKQGAKTGNAIFRDITALTNIDYVQTENDFVDFNIQKLLPHKFSEYGPSLAAGDIDGNGLDDLVSGGSSNNSAEIFLQQKDGRFISKPLLAKNISGTKSWDDAGILLFDADRDGDNDLYISSGGYENDRNTSAYQDHFYVNDGNGRFTENNEPFPVNHTSKSCVRAADFDKDGDLDLFLAGRIDPWNYPRPVSSFVFRNDSENGRIRFTDVTQEVGGDLINIGLVCDALFTDFDNDGWTDLLIAGEWMPLTFLKNTNGVFRNINSSTGIGNKTGWWTSISAGDFDNDGDIDYIAGNLGLNSFFKANDKYPVSIYAGDYDNNGSYDAFMSIYLTTDQKDTVKKEFPVHGRDDAVKQMISMRSRFQNYKSYAKASVDQLFSEDQFKSSLVLRANCFESSFCRNDGNNRFTLSPLPAQAQISALNGMVVDDFDNDGNLDIVISGNDWGTMVSVGRYDALNGLMLKGDGSGKFIAQSIPESGIHIPGNGKGLVSLKGINNKYLVAAGQNRGPVKIFELNRKLNLLPVFPEDTGAELIYKNGKTRKMEFYYGCSFLSQSGRFIKTDENMKSVLVFDYSGNRREIEIP